MLGCRAMNDRRRASLGLILVAIILSTPGLAAQGQPPGFTPPTPPPDKFDWIQLKSGEWLKGELISLYDGSLEFDSDELDNLTLDWDDVQQVRTARVMQVRFKDKTLTGRLIVEGTTV